MQQRTGIVLKKYFPKKRVIAVLDSALGLIDYVPDTENIALGALLHYWVVQRKGVSFIHGIENIQVPLLLGKYDILFFHHVLEICYYFVPRGQYSENIYMLMNCLYSADHNLMNVIQKKSFLVKLFSVLGIYPYSSAKYNSSLLQKISGSIDLADYSALDLGSERELDAWLHGCLLHHPELEKFKTTHFLDQGKTYENT